MNINTENINFASTRNSGSPFLGRKLQFRFFIFPNIRPIFRTSSQYFELPVVLWKKKQEYSNLAVLKDGVLVSPEMVPVPLGLGL